MTNGAPARGRLLGDADGGRFDATAGLRGGALALLACLLPLFAQTFQYVVDVPPLYALSKAWPLLTLPLAVLGAVRVAIPFKPLILVVLAWTLGVAPALSVIELGNSYVGAAATTLKVWSLTFALSLPVVLTLMRPSAEELRRVVIGLGVATFVLMTLLFLLAPDSAYSQGILETKLFIRDDQRGKRIYAPMFFGMMLLFILNRSFWLKPRIWKAAGILVGLLLLVFIYKQRTAIAAALVCLLLGVLFSLPRGRLTLAALLVAVSAWPAVILANSVAADLQAGFGGSFSVRQIELAAAVNFLNSEPGRWITGVGTVTRAGGASLAQVVDADVLFLADLGWLGVIFEYGVIGAVLLLLTHLAVIYVCARGAKQSDPLARALLDYSIFILVSSAVYSVVFAPGELMTCLGLSWWLQKLAADRAEATPGRVLWEVARRPAPVDPSRGVMLGRGLLRKA